MKITGQKKLVRQMRRLPDAARGHIVKAIWLNTEEGARVARTLSPNLTGETRENITTEYAEGGMKGTVVAIQTDADQAEKDRAYSIEHGRKKGGQGSTAGAHHIYRTRQYLQKKFKNRMKRAIRKAVKEVSNG